MTAPTDLPTAGPSTAVRTLPQLVHGPCITDGDLETSLVFQQGIDLSCRPTVVVMSVRGSGG